MPDFLTKLRTLAAYHASINLAVHVQHAEGVIRQQRAALLEAADRIEELETEVARLKAGG